MNPLHSLVALRAGHRYEYCHAPEIASNVLIEVEHLQPVSQHGSNEADNLALSCRSGNSFKAARITAVDPETQQTVRLFHPRRDTWHQHFQVLGETCDILGISAIGRATVTTLLLNSDQQKAARRLWMRLGLFP